MENSTHLEKNQKAVALQTLQSGGGASKPTRSSSCHEVLCRPVQERRNNEMDYSGQRGPRAEHGVTSVQTDQPPQEHRGGESDGPRPTVTSGKRRWRIGLQTGAEQPAKTEATRKSEHEEGRVRSLRQPVVHGGRTACGETRAVVPSPEGGARALAAEPSARGWTRCLANVLQHH